MRDTRFLEPTGLNAGNVSTAYDLALMADAGYTYEMIRQFTTSMFGIIATNVAGAKLVTVS